MLHWLVNGRVLDPGEEGGSSRVTANQRIAGYLFEVIFWVTFQESWDDKNVTHCAILIRSFEEEKNLI